MSELTFSARIYLIGCYLFGLIAVIGLVTSGDGMPSRDQWLLAAFLAILAALAQLLVVSRPGSHYSDHVTPAPVFAAILLVPAPLIALVVCLAFIPEWIRYRRRWFVQSFNIASWMVASSASLLVMRRLPSFGNPSDPAVNAGTLLTAMAVFVLVQTLMLGITLKLARGQSLGELGLFAPYKLLSEMALLCIGWFFAFAWQIDPVYTIPVAIPLLVVFEALNMPALRDEVNTDPKTGLANFRHFEAAANREIERAQRTGSGLSLLVCDLDLLRDINNAYGHQVGDLVLQAAAETIRQNIRGCDLAARFGGEEFMITLSDANLHAALDAAERIRTSFAARHIDVESGDRTINPTMSIGVASFPEHGDSFESIFREADLALFRAKRDGRNGVVAAGRESRELLSEWKRQRASQDALEGLIPTMNVEAARDHISMPLTDPFDLDLGFLNDGEDQPNQQAKTAVETREAQSTTSLRVLAFIGVVVILGILLALIVGVQHFPEAHSPWIGLVIFVGLVILAHRYAADLNGLGTTSVAVVPMIAAALLFNGPGVVAASAAFAVVAKMKAGSPIHRMLFNFGCMLLATGGTVLIFRSMVHGSIQQGGFVQMLVPGIIGGVVFYAVNHLFLCLVRALAEQRSSIEIWREDYRWLWPHYAVAGLLGMTLGLSYEFMGAAATIVMASPVALMHLAITQFIQRTNGYVNELRRLNRQLSDSYESTLQALSRALDTRDAETEEHSQRVRRYTELIGRNIGLATEEIAHLSRGALLHDIGKIGVPDAILLKPGGLTTEEIEAMRKHPAIGYTMIAHIPFLAPAAEIVLHHHESFDGSGYPGGLARDRIPLGARIFAVVDTLDAMTSDRPYRTALSYEEAFAEIKRERGRQFDPEIVDVLLSVPIPELKRCRDGTVADVVPEAADVVTPALHPATA